MEYVLGIIGAAAVALGLYGGVLVFQVVSGTGVSLTSPQVLVQFATPTSLVVTGIVLIAFGIAIRYLRQIRNNTDRAAHYLYAIARPPHQN